MEISKTGIDLIRDCEGCVLHAYQDGANVWTIGIGHTENVRPADVITQQEADDLLRGDLKTVETDLNNPHTITVPLNQNQYDALCSFEFNVGIGNFRASTLRRFLNQSLYREAGDQFPRWVHDVNGNTEPGLVTRRDRERTLFLLQ